MSDEPELSPKSTPAARALTALAVALFLGAVCVISLHPIAITDFWWQARTGELIVESGRIPTRDPFSWTAPGRPWVAHEWLTEVLFYGLTRLPEWALFLYKCGLAAAACGLVLWRCWRRSGSLVLAFAAGLLAAAVVRNYADLRPQMLTFVLLSLLLLGLDAYHDGRMPRLPWLLPPLFVLWANLHGGVVVGMLLLTIWVTGELTERALRRVPLAPALPLALGMAASWAGIMLNPNGVHVYLYPFQVLGHPEVQDYITEWFAPNFHNWELRAFEIMLLLTLAAGALGREAPEHSGRLPLREVLMLAAMAHAALYSQRNTAPFGLAAAPVVAAGLASYWRSVEPRWSIGLRALPNARGIAAALLSVVCVGVALLFVPPGPPSTWLSRGMGMSLFPQEAARRLEAGEWPGRMYNDYVWGGYLIWHARSRRVFIDGRAEVYYPDKVFDDEMKIHRTERGWDEALDRRGVEVVLTDKNGRLADALSRHPGWSHVFTGAVESVFVRAGERP